MNELEKNYDVLSKQYYDNQGEENIINNRENIISEVEKLLAENKLEEIKARLIEYGYDLEEIPILMSDKSNLIAAFVSGDQYIRLEDLSKENPENSNENVIVEEEKKLNREKYLPIGSIVLLKGGKKRAMITGFCSVAQENQDKIYDYSGCVYPEGYLSSNQVCLFDHDQIDKIFFVGFEDDEEVVFKEKLNRIVETIEMEKQSEKAVYGSEEFKPFED